jgi:hypothetical protein
MSFPASSYAVGNAPAGASYAAPLMNFGAIAQYPEQLYQGQQRARTTALQNAFPDGLPTDANGSPDINAISQKLTKLGGADYATQLMPFLMQNRTNELIAQSQSQDRDLFDANAPAAPRSSSVPGASGPANIRGPAPGAGPAPGTDTARPPTPPLSTFGADDGGHDTLRSVATETFGGRDVSPLIPKFAAALKIDPDAPLSPDQVRTARAIMSRTASSLSSAPAGSDVTGGGAPINPVGGTSGSGAPAAGAAPTVETPAAASGIMPRAFPPPPVPPGAPGASPPGTPAAAPPSGGVPSAAVPGVPAGYDAEGYANRLMQVAQTKHLLAERVAMFPGGKDSAAALENQAKALETRAQGVFDYMQKDQQARVESGLRAGEPTPEMKNLNSGATGRTKQLDLDITRSEKTYSGIQAQAAQYERDTKPYLELSQSILNDPSMYTGSGANAALNWDRASTALQQQFGVGPGEQRAAMLKEALQKVTATSVLGQINQQRDQLMEAGGSAGRIFAQQVDLVEKAAPQLTSTLGGNRFLVEVTRRMGELNTQVRDMAIDYRSAHGYLDAGFDKQIAGYLKTHPIFSKDELGNPALLGAPTAPPTIRTPSDAANWAGAMGLQKGDAIRTPNGYRFYQGAAPSP